MLWIMAPILVSVISFFVFIYVGNQLTVSIAFTVRLEYCLLGRDTDSSPQAIALFNMIRFVLVVVDRIATMLILGQSSLERHPCVDCANPPG
jgi:fucose permease